LQSVAIDELKSIRGGTEFGTADALGNASPKRHKSLKLEDSMKIKMIVRTQMMLMTVAAALMLASSVYAQQDMDPTPFADGPYVTTFAQPAIANANSTYTMEATNTAAAVPAASENTEMAVEEAGVAEWTNVDAYSTMVLTVLMGFGVLYGTLKSERERITRSFRPGNLNPSGATAQ
jgi:hypothetical protein